MNSYSKRTLLCAIGVNMLLSLTSCNGSPDGPDDVVTDLQRRWESIVGYMR